MNNKYIFLQNIFTPYRISLFDDLHKKGFDFAVYYMRASEADRNWKIELEKIRHPYYLDRGFYRMVGRFHVHFNPRLILKLLRTKESEIILGGSWNDLNVLTLVLLKRLGLLKNRLHFWSEANYLTIGARNDNRYKAAMRRVVFDSAEGALIIPGKMSEITFAKWKTAPKTFIRFPNTIEEEKFTISEMELLRREENDLPVLLMPVRLQEQVKGIMNFLASICDENVKKCRILIAGDGPDKGAIARYVRDHGIEDHVTLLGHCDTEKMVSLYRSANVFVLPSFSDPSPLTLVEALIMKLPVLVSRRCGNHFEAVLDGANGYLFDPAEQDSVRKAFDALLSRAVQWRNMGEISSGLYRDNFSRQAVIDGFVQCLTRFTEAAS
ncbi:glycosyltransferase family 4 protein [Geomesophilobacter sediminis]|uniref:Glycosyltransferase family 4 protein n=1 Tax=Geomesophilobacter sediminis TaxID=2798584 RepID=A0A8J7JJQ9_9BACT|nr:glycosyltransferase family 4 protein [Geomesophilobacter sediminis]MBJ6723170.1 glycosyltransferase family 4 protein [Geomesophilobacter sediminis]